MRGKSWLYKFYELNMAIETVVSWISKILRTLSDRVLSCRSDLYAMNHLLNKTLKTHEFVQFSPLNKITTSHVDFKKDKVSKKKVKMR